jgi:hypothetical protein
MLVRFLALATFIVLASGSLCHGPVVHNGFECITPDDSMSFEPCIASDAHGHVVLAWTRELGDRQDIWYVEMDSAGSWSEPVNLTESGTGEGSRAPSLCFDQSGTLHAAWASLLGNNWVILYAKRQGNGAWAVPETIRHEVAVLPRVGVDASGRVHLVFQDISSMGSNPCYVSRARSGAWSPVTVIRSGYTCFEVASAVRPDGTCVVAFTESDTVHFTERVFWVSRRNDTWTTPALLDVDTDVAAFLAMVAGSSTVYLGYQVSGHGQVRVWGSEDSTGWRGPDSLCPIGRSASGIALGSSSPTSLFVTWKDPYTREMQVASRTTKWSQAVTIAESDSTHPWSTSASVAPDGLIHLAWAGGGPERSKIYYTSLRM